MTRCRTRMQGYLGSTGFEQVQLVWAQPVGGTDNSTNTPGLGQSRPPLIVAPDGNEPSGHSSGGGTPIGPIAGGAAGGIVVLLAVWAWGALALRRRRRGQADVEGSASHKEAPVESEGELGSLSSPASGEPSAAGRGLGEAWCLEVAVGASCMVGGHMTRQRHAGDLHIHSGQRHPAVRVCLRFWLPALWGEHYCNQLLFVRVA